MSQPQPQPATVPAGQQPPVTSPNLQQTNQAQVQAQQQHQQQQQQQQTAQQQAATANAAAAAAAAAAANLYGNGGGLFEPQGGIFDMVKRKLREAAGYRTPMLDPNAMAVLSRYGGAGGAGASMMPGTGGMMPHPMMMLMPGAGAGAAMTQGQQGMLPFSGSMGNNNNLVAGSEDIMMLQQQQQQQQHQQQQQQALMMALMTMAAAGGNNGGNNHPLASMNMMAAAAPGNSNMLLGNNISNMNPAMLAAMYQSTFMSATPPLNTANGLLPTTPGGAVMMSNGSQMNPFALLQQQQYPQSGVFQNPLLQQQQHQPYPAMINGYNQGAMYSQPLAPTNTAFNYMSRTHPMSMYGAAGGGYGAHPVTAGAVPVPIPVTNYGSDQHYYPAQNSSYYHGYGTTPYASTGYYRDPYSSSYSDPSDVYGTKRSGYF
ncbi:hypothetical protein BDF20DRAFT_908877 [Mycotypha africana]|uniref:uncharacterized protein n=1 Tax=Mycotypha africana TaxID=64632 RepID=UPI002300820D|nr:uncharacterized protein BDF20DRAFT_908877 [Mycotypha africana]KAI8991064.1 hypothetical protein BDF20DRAFT_908877 [Mycotypha africana]